MTVAALTVDAWRLSAADLPSDWPLAFIDLNATDEVSEPFGLPPYPVIGLGDGKNPLAQFLDAIVEQPASPETLVRQVTAQPQAAAVTVQLLRTLPALSEQSGLTVESLAYAVLQGSNGHRDWIANRVARPATSTNGQVVVTREEAELRIELSRPEQGNAIDRTMRDQLFEGFSLAAIDPEIFRAILKGRGRSFCLGADLDEFGTTTDPATAHAIRAQTLPAHAIRQCADKLEVHIKGACVGAGLEMAAWAKTIYAAPDAWFQLPELAMGVLPGAGGCVSITRRIGRQRTALMILSGKRISAKTALEWGLIDAIMDHFPCDEGGTHQS